MRPVQSLDTSGARAVETFVHAGRRYLVVPQLARDIPGAPAVMTQGDSGAPTLVFRWQDGRFEPCAELDVPGGEDAEYLRIGDREFLAVASLRSGAGPYAYAVPSTIFELRDGAFRPFQAVDGFAAKQWRHFTIGSRHFLALAQGVTGEGASRPSCILEWRGARFEHLQDVPSAWGYNWHFLQAGGHQLLAHADHAVPSTILRWTGERFEPFQELEGRSGRAFRCFRAGGETWLAFAILQEDSWLLRWDGTRFVRHAVLCGPGAREFCWLEDRQELVVVHFLRGSREAPVTQLASQLLRFTGDGFKPAGEFTTNGATDVARFTQDGQEWFAVSESLSPQVRFRTPTRIWQP
jgi:hypothetical protein